MVKLLPSARMTFPLAKREELRRLPVPGSRSITSLSLDSTSDPAPRRSRVHAGERDRPSAAIRAIALREKQPRGRQPNSSNRQPLPDMRSRAHDARDTRAERKRVSARASPRPSHSPISQPSSSSVASTSAPAGTLPCSLREQGGVSLRFASLRALHCGHTREDANVIRRPEPPWISPEARRAKDPAALCCSTTSSRSSVPGRPSGTA